MDKIKPLTRDQMKLVIEGRGQADRVPMMYHFWCNADRFGKHIAEAQEILNTYPMDAEIIRLGMPSFVNIPYDEPKEKTALDEKVIIKDWDVLDEIMAAFPSAENQPMPIVNETDGRYRLGSWWFCYFERLWGVRGMTNALMDFYLYPQQVHTFFRVLTDYYKQYITRMKKEGLGLDGIFTSDDLGTQTATFFSLDIFREFFKPYYKEIIDCAHDNDMHFWLHICGNVELFMPDFIEIGLDVIHPIQKYAMDEKNFAQKYQKDICIWAGFDLQQTFPYGTPDDVRDEVRFMIDTYRRADGRLILTMGNQVTDDAKVENLLALMDESYIYGGKAI